MGFSDAEESAGGGHRFWGALYLIACPILD